ncbi:hypothetical protein PSHT_16115 [Puccinia striiformis]|uniref:Uncharacterized protein n=1 Tax=Puccinia striiformis TaxID=27350 RepID=A0A2S4UBE7_9BASI|nr:hypothetical protein PSHT_16115 [Puccinia striiformis]
MPHRPPSLTQSFFHNEPNHHTRLTCLSLAAVDATIHTLCFNFFMKKDKCVHAAAGQSIRCDAPPKPHDKPVTAFVMQTPKPQSRLERRYNTNGDTILMSSGPGICGEYNTEKEDGVCLWSGPEQVHPTINSAGWLNGVKTSNCRKQVYIQRHDEPDKPFYVPVLDGCGFHKTKPEEGCFEIGVTKSLARKLRRFPNETDDTPLYGGFTWDFNNLLGNNPDAGPV